MWSDADEYFRTDLFGDRVGVIFSKDKTHRFVLYKIWDVDKPSVMFIGLNPSTANHERNDNTITKVKKIAKNNGFGSLYMLNLFSLISPHPEDLLKCPDPIMNNDEYLNRYAKICDKIVFCWGVFPESKKRNQQIIDMFPNAMALAITKDGSPKHPLYCKDNTILIPYGKTAD